MFQSGFKFYQYFNPGRFLAPGVQLNHQTALTLLFDQFAYFFLQIIHELWLLQSSKTEFYYRRPTLHSGWWRFFGDFEHFSGILPVINGKKPVKPT